MRRTRVMPVLVLGEDLRSWPDRVPAFSAGVDSDTFAVLDGRFALVDDASGRRVPAPDSGFRVSASRLEIRSRDVLEAAPAGSALPADLLAPKAFGVEEWSFLAVAQREPLS